MYFKTHFRGILEQNMSMASIILLKQVFQRLLFSNMAERRMLIDWVNSIDMPSCLLVSTVEDLRDGIALCDIYSYL